MTMHIYTDGASRSNPGKAAIGYQIYEDDKVIKQAGKFLGVKTNNEAEYTAMITALDAASKLTKGEVHCHSDSELLVKQLRGEYKVKEPRLKVLFDEVKKKEQHFEKVSYTHLRREHPRIAQCDQLANDALDDQMRAP